MKNRKKQRQREEMEQIYIDSLKHKKIPLLTLDSRWHELFPDFRKTDKIRKCEKNLNLLIQKQGQTTNDIKDYDKAKLVLMDNIVANMTDGYEEDSSMRSKKQDNNQRLITELNDKITESELLLEHLPKSILVANQELLIASMEVCYEELVENTGEIEKLEEWVQKVREELKDQILLKQDMEMRNTQLYTYMHNLLGPEVVEVFDRQQHVWKGNVEETRKDEEDK